MNSSILEKRIDLASGTVNNGKRFHDINQQQVGSGLL